MMKELIIQYLTELENLVKNSGRHTPDFYNSRIQMINNCTSEKELEEAVIYIAAELARLSDLVNYTDKEYLVTKKIREMANNIKK